MRFANSTGVNMATTIKEEDHPRTRENEGIGSNVSVTTEYCAKLQEWMWQYYCGYASWQNWLFMSTFPFPPTHPLQLGNQASTSTPFSTPTPTPSDIANWYNQFAVPVPTYTNTGPQPGHESPGTAVSNDAVQAQTNGNAAPAGREYTIPSPLHRFLAETVDFFILFCIKATIVLWVMHLSGMKDISKFVMHFIVEEIDENTSMEDLQKMMAVALVYRVLVCFYEIICIWGAGGATPGKFLLGLRVVTCDNAVLVRPSRVLVVPATNVSLSASTVRALNKNFSIAFLFPVFITLLFFQHNRTVYDIVAGTIVVKRRGAR
ncbi:protein FAM8A1 [Chanos chanos]|uniref:Protein FAM8A1 n=1 Tax=Chanos chanos TaxID=29144 RepID=A0A6J2WPM8_CHACN|nr:protein FAM8A1-like [Chanos chanos]